MVSEAATAALTAVVAGLAACRTNIQRIYRHELSTRPCVGSLQAEVNFYVAFAL